MSRILFAWELGGNLGHMTRQLPIARRLRQQGHQVFFVVRDTAVAAQLLTPEGFAYAQAPVNVDKKRLPHPVNYAEILIASGYADPAVLLGLVQGWISLIRLFKADLIVVDHAPTALVAARLTALPAITIGTGFEIPPNCLPLPSIRPWETIPTERLLRAEEYVLERLNALATFLKGGTIERITDLFQGARKVLATFAELDHYGTREGENYVGPLYTGTTGQLITWHQIDKPHVFAYLRPDAPGFENLLKALSKLSAEVIVVAPGIKPAHIQAFATLNLRILTQPVQTEQLFKMTDCAVTTGGTGTVSQCLLAGIPLLLVPQNVEQFLMSLRVEVLGAGTAARNNRQEQDFAGLLEALLKKSCYRLSARAFAQQYAGYAPAETTDNVIQLIDSTLTNRDAVSSQ
ncbi:glycosyltransferase [Methylomonas sp. MK1]|uniref:glycosyltransferase n=1 Tax=Methylomonas sp. MK1 TaxID=1131552 RepID=UPI00038075EC|nr:nucleotide disphospho-sugar-binding domain-containing protein [Methylomonas sp. MK1]